MVIVREFLVSVREFLARVVEICAECPGYELGHSGYDHLCDCIGLIIGAIRRAGGQWHGTHGTNYAARHEMVSLSKIDGVKSLKPGEVVYKARPPGDSKYSLPAKYKSGTDQLDYYHIGVVVSVSPLRIYHMTAPKPKVDTSIGKWAYHGMLKKISTEVIPVGTLVNYAAKVIGDGMLNMRTGPDAKASRIMQLPVGTVVAVNEEDGDWSQVSYAGKTGYVMAKYLSKDTSVGAMIAVDRSVLEAIYDEIGDLLGLRG